MSFVIRQYSNKIFKSSLNLNNKQIASKISSFTKSNHSINYACWSSNGEKLVYVGKPIDQYNVYLIDLNTNKEKIVFEDFQMKTQLRFIPENESLSFLTLDRELWELPINGEQPRIIFPRLPEAQTIRIHNYCWGKTSNSLYALVSRKDSLDWRGIVKLNLNTQSIEFVIKEIKTPKLVQWELRLSPDGNKLGLRCHPDDNSKYQEIRIIDIENQTQRLIMRTPPVIPVGELSWTPDSQFLVFGAYTEKHDFNIYYYSVRDKTLNIFSSRPLTESYYPGQISPKGDEIILYIEKENSNIWMLSEN